MSAPEQDLGLVFFPHSQIPAWNKLSVSIRDEQVKVGWSSSLRELKTEVGAEGRPFREVR